MPIQTWLFFVWLAVMALGRLIRSRSTDPLRPTVTRARGGQHKPAALRPPYSLRARIYMPGGLLAALDRADRNDEPWATLPPGKRDAELETLLEWIVNAKTYEVLEIISEIRRHYHNTGDIEGGNALKRALRQSLKATSMAEREAILRAYEPYTLQARLQSVWIEEAGASG